MNEFDLPRLDFYRYLQIRSYLFKHPDWNRIKKSDSPIEQYLTKIQIGKHIGRPISNVYRILSAMKQENTLHFKQKWEAVLKIEIREEVWDNIASEMHKVTNVNLWRKFQWKIVHRFFRTP